MPSSSWITVVGRIVAVVARGAAGLAGLLLIVGVCGTRLGGEAPGLGGTPGFLVESLAAAWDVFAGACVIAGGLAFAIRQRVAGAVLCGVALLAWLPLGWDIAFAGPTTDQPCMRVASVNLAAHRETDDRARQALLEFGADVIVVSEWSDAWRERIGDDGRERWPFRYEAFVPKDGPHAIQGFNLAVWSRFPAANPPDVLRLDGWLPALRVELEWQGRRFALYAIHPTNPFPRGVFDRAHRNRVELLEHLRREELPVLVVGDFNAPPRSAFLLRLREMGLSNASETFLGYAPATWPSGMPGPIRVAIDHVMHSGQWGCAGFEVLDAVSSDHRRVIAQLGWR